MTTTNHAHPVDQKNYVALLMEHEPGAAVRSSLEALIQADSHLLKVDANERSISHRLAMYLSKALPEWDVDCEYNRNGDIPKRLIGLNLKPTASDTDAETVYPDVIAHRRGRDENYVVIEIKKSSSKVARKIEFRKTSRL